MRRVILESPYAANLIRTIEDNLSYARRCMHDCLQRDEAPLASHLLYTQPGILRDHEPEERMWGIAAGLVWAKVADATVVYVDHGISSGMKRGIEDAMKHGRPIEYRKIGI